MRTLGELRKAANLSQHELARRVGLSQSKVARMERGLAPVPEQRFVSLLAGALGCDESVVANAASQARFARRGLLEAVRAGDLDRVGRIAQTRDVPLPVRRDAARAYSDGLRRLATTIEQLGDQWIGQLTAAGVYKPPEPPKPKATRSAESWSVAAELTSMLNAVPDETTRRE